MDQQLFERVCNAPGVPGYEDEAQKVAMEVLGGCCDEVRRDRLGNVIALHAWWDVFVMSCYCTWFGGRWRGGR